MKAAILTFHMADNYGAVLQAYALQRTLLKLGVDNEILTTDFSDNAKNSTEHHSGAASVLRNRILKENDKRHRLFEEFRRTYLRCSVKYSDPVLVRANRNYDFFITGSDQVWNLRIPGTSGRYFLPFADPKKRVSYAASFGSEDLPEKSREWCAKQLREFAHLSVREKTGQELIFRMTGRESSVTLDPVLLPGRNEWDALISAREDAPYYLLYMITYDGELAMRAKHAAMRDGVGLRTVCGTFAPQCGFDPWSGVGVGEWLSLIAGAQGVFTNSFHGTAFSLIYEHKVMVSGLKGALSGRNGRILELLEIAGLLETAGDERFSGDTFYSLPPGVFEKRLSSAKEKSLQYLKEVKDYAEHLQDSC